MLLSVLIGSGSTAAQDAPPPGSPASGADAIRTVAEEDPETTEMRRRYAALLQKKFLLQREMQLKDLQLDLAATDDPYLVIDLEDRELNIYIRATRVRTAPLQTVFIEGERQMFSAAKPPPDWANRTYTVLGKSGPMPDVEKVRPGEGLGVDESVNPRSVTAEMIGLQEKNLPARYTLVFEEGAAVSIGGEDRLSAAEKTWLERGFEIVGDAIGTPDLPDAADREGIRVWIHVKLDEDEARTLYPTIFSGMRAMFRMPGDPAF